MHQETSWGHEPTVCGRNNAEKVLETITPSKRSETPAANVVCMYDYAEVVKLGTCGM